MRLAVFGASGFSREVVDVALVCGWTEIAFLDREPAPSPELRFPILEESKARELASQGWRFIIGTGDNATRRKICEKFSNLDYINVIHPSATFGHLQRQAFDATRGNIVTAGVRFTNNIKVGDFGIYNLNCTIGHDCVIGDFVNIAPGANISGNVQLSDGCYIGTNAAVLQGRTITEKLVIGEGSTVGMGSVVTKSVPPGVVVKGVPAK